ncbi:MAG: hypothetical protein HY800_03660 [Ignavibacteriales bacterium]|nr:hypothetical protein [Ignavibacteriales bacterium]
MAKEIIAGISVSGKLAHLAVFEIRETETKLLHIEEFTNTSGDELWFLSKVLNPNSRILKKITKVSVALDSASIVLHRFPMDITLTQAEQNEHVHWELSNFITDYQAKDYVYDLHILRLNAREQVADLLVVAVKRVKIYKIQEALAAKK